MNLNELLSQKSSAIRKKWFDAVVETYPPESSQFLKNNKTKFGNPVGEAISQGIKGIVDGLLGDKEPEYAAPFLDRIIRVRAVQDFTPSHAVRFIYLLKDVIRDVALGEIRENGLYDELLNLESKIDDLTALSFDIYMQCKEKLYEIRANELNRWTYKILENANVLKDGSNGDNK